MSFRSELARIIEGRPKAPAEPVTKGGSGNADKNAFARIGRDDKTDRRTAIRRFMKNYKRGGPYADAVDAYHLFALANGYKFVCDPGDEGLKERVVAWCDQPHVDFDMILQQGILSAKLAGDAYQEIVPTKDGKDVWTVLTRDPSTFDKVPDKWGRVEKYVQYTKDATGIREDKTEIEPDRILNLVIDTLPGGLYGQSIWDRAEDNINQDCDMIESTTKAMHRHGTTKGVWNLGSEDDRAGDAEIKGFRKEVEEMDAKTDFVVTHDTKYTNIDTTGIPNVDVYSNVSLQRTACALGVPEEMLGLGRGSTEATATVRMDAFLKRITTMQAVVARAYSRKLIDRITGAPGAVWIEFGKPPQDILKLAQAVAALRAGPDADAVAPADWCREQFGVPPDEDPDLGDIPDDKEVVVPDKDETTIPPE